MNTEELAFVNRQLAGMLRSGIPLEAGLKKIAESMSDNKLKGQLAELGERLERGQAMEQSVGGLDLPETYKRLLALGQASQGMPKVLTCVADYYERIGALTTRLRGLAIYPVLILVCGMAVAGLMAYLTSMLKGDLYDITDGMPDAYNLVASPWFSIFPVFLLALVLLFYGIALRSRNMRQYFAWRIPMLRDAALAQYAALTEALLASGARLPEVIGMVRRLEAGTAMELDLAKIEKNLEAGLGSYEAAASESTTIPGFFNWVVGQTGEDVTTGFGHARTIYTSRAETRMLAFLHCFLPVNILLIGILLLGFFIPHLILASNVIRMIQNLGS